MARMNDREAFEAELSRPPHVARMLEHAGYFVERLDRTDKEMLLTTAMDRLYEQRERIKETKDILTLWIDALKHAAHSRPRWRIWFNGYEPRWVKGSQLGRPH